MICYAASVSHITNESNIWFEKKTENVTPTHFCCKILVKTFSQFLIFSYNILVMLEVSLLCYSEILTKKITQLIKVLQN